MRSAPLLVLFLLAACGPEEPFTEVLAPDADASGAPGERGSLGVEASRRVLVDDEGRSVESLVYRPVGEGPFPPVVFIQGGLVSAERYEWAGVHLASRGAVVALPEHAFDLALFSPDNPDIALGGLRANEETAAFLDGPALALGHSLGGVLAANSWQRSGVDDFLHLALLASIPDGEQSFPGKDGGRVVSVVGSRDQSLTPDEARDGAEDLPDVTGAIVDGMNHYQWTDDATEGELDGDGEPTLSLEEARRLGMTLVDALLEDLRGDPAPLLDDPSLWPEGLDEL